MARAGHPLLSLWLESYKIYKSYTYLTMTFSRPWM